MANPPELGFDADYTRLLLADVDGDGAADLIQLTGQIVRVWINQSGNGFAAPREIQAVPTARMTAARVADMRGTGAAGLLWCMSARPGEPVYFFLDLTGDAKPYLLTTIDNGVRLPVVLPVVARVDATDAATGLLASQTFRYSEGRWDGMLREFAGFGTVVDTLIGDDAAPSLQTVSTFATGLDPATGTEPATTADRLRWRAIRGRLLERAHYGPDGSPLATFPFDITTWQWRVDVDGSAFVPRLTGQVQAAYERQPAPVSTLTTTNVSFDAAGNVTQTIQTAENPADPGQTSTLRTVTSYATDPAGRFPAKPWRVTQSDGSGTVMADTVVVYDHQPEGAVGAQGVVTARSALALTSEQATIAYGAQQPDFAALGYHKRAGEDGWWVFLAAYTRTDDAAGLSGTVTGPLGGVTRFTFDATRTVPVSITDPAGNVVRAVHDYRVNRVASLTEASGEVYTASFDPLSRPVSIVHPGDTTALATLSFRFDVATVPVTTAVHQRAVSGQAATIDSRSRYDGAGRLLERRVRDESGEIVLEAHTYGARGLAATSYQPSRAAGPDYAPPGAGTPHTSMSYDALGRLVRVVNPDGSIRTISYQPLLIEEADEEDNNPGGPHAGTPVRKHLDPTGRVISVQLDLGGRTISDSHSYTVKGELSRHVDALGNEVRVWYDCLGHIVRADRPECSSRSVYDPAGNPVRAQSATDVLVVRDFDLLNRPVTVRYGSAAATPAIEYAYHDAGGSTILDYDQCGRLTKRAAAPAGLATSYQVDSAYRPDGQLASLTYPGTGHRLTLTYDYDAGDRDGRGRHSLDLRLQRRRGSDHQVRRGQLPVRGERRRGHVPDLRGDGLVQLHGRGGDGQHPVGHPEFRPAGPARLHRPRRPDRHLQLRPCRLPRAGPHGRAHQDHPGPALCDRGRRTGPAPVRRHRRGRPAAGLGPDPVPASRPPRQPGRGHRRRGHGRRDPALRPVRRRAGSGRPRRPGADGLHRRRARPGLGSAVPERALVRARLRRVRQPRPGGAGPLRSAQLGRLRVLPQQPGHLHRSERPQLLGHLPGRGGHRRADRGHHPRARARRDLLRYPQRAHRDRSDRARYGRRRHSRRPCRRAAGRHHRCHRRGGSRRCRGGRLGGVREHLRCSGRRRRRGRGRAAACRRLLGCGGHRGGQWRDKRRGHGFCCRLRRRERQPRRRA
jgi:YD repeat-containing protein